MTKIDTFSDNQIAKGHNNFSGLTNIELQAVGGNVPDPYLLPVDDLASFLDGVDRVQGDGITAQDGFASTDWLAGALSFSQWYFLFTSILGGKRSGNVTVKTRRYAVPMNGTMSYRYIIANAVLTLRPQPDEQRGDYVAGFKRFLYQFTRIDLNSLLHEDKMKGTLYVTGGSTAQTGITTSPEKLVAFTTSGLNEGVTTSPSDDSHTIVVATDYKVTAVISFTSDASVLWTFQVRVDGAAVGAKSIIESNATPDAEQVTLFWQQANDAAEVITIYVNSDEGGGKDLTVVDAIFAIESS